MKKELVLLLLGALSYPASANNLYVFEQLTEAAGKPPAAIRREMLRSEAVGLKDCQKQLKLSQAQIDNIFVAVPIDLNGDAEQDYLILPTRSCYSFVGAHAISFWLFLGSSPGQFSMLLTGKQDALEIMSSKTKDLFDLQTYYGPNSTYFKYNGHGYER